ncbi:Transcription factor iws1 [Ceratobasidium theobromae]|uniref:Transcription factor iws1 n=1 Tax=Ceratobasidium theobromae TaxID=1582974 RepID=A0A5N5QJ46_9AGAM|nr:Transcription factor iws1 [Ceratobasidium theobromae]
MAQAGLERDIFGGSDDSDLSEDERQTFRQRKVSSRSESPMAAREDAGSDYNDEGTGRPGSLKFTKRRKSSGGADGDGIGGSVVPKKRRKRREKEREREPSVEADKLPELTPEERRRLELSQKIDSIIKPSKSGKRKKRKKEGDEEELDMHADEEVTRLRQAMHAAADRDIEANASKQPAVAKLKMLGEVMDTLQKSSLAQSVLDNNLFEGVRRWLEPLPDKSLPALSIQNAFFEIMPKLFIDTATLKESGLGKIVLFYTKCKRVTPAIRRIADTLVANWSRPIVKRSASYRDRLVPTAEAETVVRTEKLSKLLERAALGNAGRGRKNAVRIPESAIGRYTVAPKIGTSNVGANVAADVERRKANQERLRRMQRKLDTARQKMSRA